MECSFTSLWLDFLLLSLLYHPAILSCCSCIPHPHFCFPTHLLRFPCLALLLILKFPSSSTLLLCVPVPPSFLLRLTPPPFPFPCLAFLRLSQRHARLSPPRAAPHPLGTPLSALSLPHTADPPRAHVTQLNQINASTLVRRRPST